MENTNLQVTLAEDVEITRIEGLRHDDWPDFVDAYVAEAFYLSSQIYLTDAELDAFNDHFPDIVQEKAREWSIC